TSWSHAVTRVASSRPSATSLLDARAHLQAWRSRGKAYPYSAANVQVIVIDGQEVVIDSSRRATNWIGSAPILSPRLPRPGARYARTVTISSRGPASR